MAKFAWQGRTKAGKVEKGVMEAPDVEAVVAKLRSQEISPLQGSIKPKGLDFSMEINIPGFEPKVKDKDVIIFTRQFATMIDAGLPLVQCLDLLATESDNRTFKKVLNDIKETVEAGSTFADALARHPKVFNNLYVQMVKAGEIGGILDTILNRLALSMEKSARLKKQIKSAMVYPAIVISVAVVVISVLLIFVIPVFSKMFKEMGAELPALTQYIVSISNWLTVKFGFIYILVATGGFIAAYVMTNNNKKGQFMLHSFYLKIPIIGDLIKKTAVASFTRTLGTLISSGVPIMDGLEIVARVAGNRVVEKELVHVRTSIAEGKTLSEPMRESKVFPHMVVQMIGVGEQTGALDTMLAKIADFYEEEVDDAVAALTSMLEPLLMVFLGVAVGGIVIAMYLPIFTMAASFGDVGG
ncbi:MAG TPA: type II secretion system F family protein [bacterium]|nr:type II secretion system F family protein [bacterium]